MKIPSIFVGLVVSANLLALPLAVSAASKTVIDGKYIIEGGFVEVTIAPCASARSSARCGTITRILKRKQGESDLDAHNDDPALRKRPINGITLLTNLRLDDGVWRGKIYNPEDGGTYRAEVRAKAGGAIEVKGCLLFICRGRLWRRAR